MTKKSRQKLKYLENEKSFRGEIKSIFHHFKSVSVAKNCLRPKSAPLTIKTPERRQWRQWRRSGVFIVNFEHIS